MKNSVSDFSALFEKVQIWKMKAVEYESFSTHDIHNESQIELGAEMCTFPRFGMRLTLARMNSYRAIKVLKNLVVVLYFYAFFVPMLTSDAKIFSEF